MNAVSILMMFALFAPVSAMVVMNLVMYRQARYVRLPEAPMSPAPACEAVVTELPAEAVALQKAYELRKAA
jgi:heme/copper-type cytochrome/quinol oxidase subunit 2